MIRRLLLVLLFVPILALADDEPPTTTPQEATRTKCGEEAPTFVVELVDGTEFDLAAKRGTVVLVNFWATWCPPCVKEMPHLCDEVLRRFEGTEFTMVCVAREEPNELIAKFARKHEVTELPMGGDVDRSIYAQYADHTIPRSIVVDRDGTILFQFFGFERPDFEKMIEIISVAVRRRAI